MVRRPLSVLCDLRPAFEGFYGIAQETRSMFASMLAWDSVDTTGLIHHPNLMLARALPRDSSYRRTQTPAQRLDVLSRFVVSTRRRPGRLGSLQDAVTNAVDIGWLQLLAKLGAHLPLDEFDGGEFGDFLWQTLFASSLPASSFERCRQARYATLWASWSAMHGAALVPWPRAHALVDTTGYDVLVAQTPWPGTVGPQTQLVIRYHDAVPLLLPHTINSPRAHRFLHYSALQENAKSAVFACVSESSKSELLRIFPALESRAFVVHNGLSENYFPDAVTRDTIRNIILSRVDESTEPRIGSPINRAEFYQTHLGRDNRRFVLVVSTLEPRKNHLQVLRAWEALRLKSPDPVALVFVGSPGWSNRPLLREMQKWQSLGELFHLSAVPEPELRKLYAAADIVVAPSVSEGFDLPSVEAMRCGAALAASDIPVHRELLGEAALYFNPYSVDSISDALEKLLANDTLRHDLSQKALRQGQQFNRENVRGQWQQVFDHCLARRPAT